MITMNRDSTITSIEITINSIGKPSRVETLYLGHVYVISYLNRKKVCNIKGAIKAINPTYTNDKFTIIVDCSDDKDSKRIELSPDDIIDVRHCKNIGPEPCPPPHPGDNPPKPPSSRSKFETMSLEEYNNIKTKRKDVIYFINDTHEIYKDDVNYTENIIIISQFPQEPIKDKLYINKNTSEAKIYNGSEWIQIFKSVVAEITADISDAIPTTEAVKKYISDNISDQTTEVIEEKVNEAIVQNIEPIANDIEKKVTENVISNVQEILDDGEI